MTTPAPVDPTTTSAWADLTTHYQGFRGDLRGWFDNDPDRAERLSFEAGDLFVDLSKNLVTDETLALLVRLAHEVNLPERIEAMFTGERINVTEDRAVLHTALRRAPGTQPPLVVDGQDVDADVAAELDKMSAFADKVRSGEWTGVTGKRVETVVNIGIGGSDLGPVMVYEALAPYRQDGLSVRFVSNIDPTDVAQKTADLDPETTLFIVASKTFGTLETLTNARLARAWLLNALVARGAIKDTEEARRGAVGQHFVAVSTALDKVAAFGIDPANAFGFWDWVGGRYSVDSAIGTSVAVAIGPDRFRELLAGFRAVDEHFRTTPFERNVPALMGLLNVWYTNFLGAQTHAVLPYAQQLHRFAAYLQQLTMESNGKSVRWDGTPVTTQTGEVFWGEPGTNGQHAFYQLIHQGTRLVPADFIAVANPAYPLVDAVGDGGAVQPGSDVHELFLANFFAQTKALAFGKTAEEVRAEGTAEEIVPARVFSGNRPTTSILAPALTPSVVGQLVALYEHVTFTQGVVWGIDSFDQWGVELGKKLALEIAPAVSGDADALAAQDPSTRSLVSRYRSLRRG
ncbi:glucose-6-phosphate isomerase [Xylanimonas oleitrophica]|uniref:Glucose-6-phosphate isomerase n=1 Tax=Xylanimonas oleitrophica TaxID=2607479 RepID=A0A2W5WKU0_9MICO|nr:glucose-6-phosphate isomerase [Xylanimonas oleitrophica]PZR52169.1 glucose-6-phosphate isomerase [Xylanimonas oleitrophica]